ALHIKRLRDANEGPAGAMGVAIIYSLALGLLLLVVGLFNSVATPHVDGSPGEPARPVDTLFALFLILLIFSLLFSPDFGMFATIIKLLVLIGCLPALISLVFSIRTGLRESAPSTPPAPAAAPPAPATPAP